MPISGENKKGYLQNAAFGMLQSKAILDEALTNKSMNKADFHSAMIAITAIQNILLATLTQALITNMDEPLVSLVRSNN